MADQSNAREKKRLNACLVQQVLFIRRDRPWLPGRNHQLNDDLAEVAEDVRALT